MNNKGELIMKKSIMNMTLKEIIDMFDKNINFDEDEDLIEQAEIDFLNQANENLKYYNDTDALLEELEDNYIEVSEEDYRNSLTDDF